MYISKMTIPKLKNEYKATWQMIYQIRCYGTNDLKYLNALEKELEKRGIEVQFTPEFI